MLDLLSRYFAVISSSIIVVASTISMIFLFSYLSVFDWTLIWLLEYGDLAKMLLLSAALISTVLVAILNYTWDVYQYFLRKVSGHKVFKLLFIAIFVAGIGLNFYLDRNSPTGIQIYHAFRSFSFIGIFTIIYIAFSVRNDWVARNWAGLINYLTFLAILIPIFATTIGMYVKYTPGLQHEISTKDAKFSDARIIMMLSHHTALLIEERVIVLKTGDIIQISSAANKFWQ